jgi:hypothetical protein
VKLTGVRANEDDLIMNATLFWPGTRIADWSSTVSSPTDGQIVKIIWRVSSRGNENAFYVCGAQQANPDRSRCDLHELLNTGGNSPIRVSFPYL